MIRIGIQVQFQCIGYREIEDSFCLSWSNCESEPGAYATGSPSFCLVQQRNYSFQCHVHTDGSGGRGDGLLPGGKFPMAVWDSVAALNVLVILILRNMELSITPFDGCSVVCHPLGVVQSQNPRRTVRHISPFLLTFRLFPFTKFPKPIWESLDPVFFNDQSAGFSLLNHRQRSTVSRPFAGQKAARTIHTPYPKPFISSMIIPWGGQQRFLKMRMT